MNYPSWKVGVLFSKTGPLAVIEETQLRGTLLAIDEINDQGGINGRPIETVYYDPGSDASVFGKYAKKMMVEDGISTIFGCYSSSSRKSVVPVVERLNGLLWYPTVYEGFEFSTNVIYTGAAPNQNCVELCNFLMQHYGNRFYFVGTDYVYPRVSNKIVREFVTSNGGEVVGEKYVGLTAQHHEYAPIMRDIYNLKPDVIFSTVVGKSTSDFYQSYMDFGFNPKEMPIASLTTTEAEIYAMGTDVGEGHITGAPYFEGLNNNASLSFTKRYKQRYGVDEHTNTCVETAYFQVHMFAEALKKSNSLNTDRLRANVLGIDFDAPQGNVAINLSGGHADVWTRVGRATRSGLFDILYASKSAVVADPYLLSYGAKRQFAC
ncbi:MAG: transporter substrate-binding domain-containing protein [Gammaproteobacteria bacterium]